MDWSSYDEMQLCGIDGDQIRFDYLHLTHPRARSISMVFPILKSSPVHTCALV